MSFDPFPIPDTAPDEGPFAIIRVGAAWRSFLLGAISDSLDRRGVFVGDEAAQADLDQQLDQLLQQVAEDYSPVGPHTTIIPAYGWIAVTGVWLRIANLSTAYQKTLYQQTPLTGNQVSYPVTLPAGTYTVRVQHIKHATGAECRFRTGPGGTGDALFSVVTYNAATLLDQVHEEALVVSEDFDGQWYMRVVDNPFQPGSQEQSYLHDITITRTG